MNFDIILASVIIWNMLLRNNYMSIKAHPLLEFDLIGTELFTVIHEKYMQSSKVQNDPCTIKKLSTFENENKIF